MDLKFWLPQGFQEPADMNARLSDVAGVRVVELELGFNRVEEYADASNAIEPSFQLRGRHRRDRPHGEPHAARSALHLALRRHHLRRHREHHAQRLGHRLVPGR